MPVLMSPAVAAANTPRSKQMTNRELMQAEALDRATNGQSLTNYPAIYEGFMAKGIAEAEILPRENVFTFNAWKAKGRSVKKGEHGVKVVTFVECSGRDRDPASGEEKAVTFRRPHTTTVFHISQTEPTAEREARRASSSSSSHRGYRRPAPAPRVEAWPDPGELAADRWNESYR
jgi:hypothetical protein